MSRYPLAFQSGGSPLTPRIAVWRKDPELCLGSFFIVPSNAWRRFEGRPRVTDRRGKSFLPSLCRRRVCARFPSPGGRRGGDFWEFGFPHRTRPPFFPP